MVRQLPYNKPAKKGKGMTGFLMIKITLVWSESFRTDFRGLCSILS
ncbi:unnamed protein product [Tenebrio molitor]|nr:unnamed protein product [Tenebrio molitor]